MKKYVKDGVVTTTNSCKTIVEVITSEGVVKRERTIVNASDKQMKEAGYELYNEHLAKEIKRNKRLLADSDYKVIKCYEASIKGDELPYDLPAVIELRDGYRAEINSLEEDLREYLAQL